MAYLGQTVLPFDPLRSAAPTSDADRFSGNGSTTTFTLSRPVTFPTDLEVFVENIQQEPINSYSVVGTSLVFTEAPPSGTNNVYVVYRNYQSGAQITLPDGSVTYNKLANNIRLFTTDNYTSNAGVSTFTMSEQPADANTVLVTIDGIVQRATEHYSVSGRTITFTSTPAANSLISIRHLGFRTTTTVTAISPGANLSNPIVVNGMSITGNTTLSSGSLVLSPGTAGQPALSFAGNTSTGIFFPATSTIAFSEGGTEAMRIDASGRLLVGDTTSRSSYAIGQAQLQIASASFSTFGMFGNANNTDGSYISLNKARGGTLGGTTAVQSGDILGGIFFEGYNGTGYTTAAHIYAKVDGTANSSQMPGRLEFYTTPTGSNAAVERARIASDGTFTYNASTLASYLWTSWTPTNLTGTITNAPSTGTTDDNNYVTMSNSSGTLTITFDVAGKYLISILSQTNHGQTYTLETLFTNLGGTATRRIGRDDPQNWGDSGADGNIAITTSFYVSATASQTLTIQPQYRVTGAGTTANHIAYCSVTVLYCGG